MALTPEQRIQLIQTYAPILFFHPEERFVPVRPDLYLRGCSLWKGDQTGDKHGWGLGGPGFPRKPLIPHDGITLDPAGDTEGKTDVDGNGVPDWYLGHFNAKTGIFPYLRSLDSEELWLDRGGWLDGDDVTDVSSNESCNLEKLQSIFTPDPSTLFDPVQNWYYGEAMEIEEFQKFFVNLAAGPADAENLLRNQFGDVWVIWYYFLYPGHEEFLRRCEAFFNEKSDGDYEGDWNAVAVLVQRPSPLPWETPGQPVFPEPSHVGYGVRLRGLGKDVVSQDTFKQGMTSHKWTDIEKDTSSGFHPRVYVAQGYHNNYATPGAHVPRDPTLLSINIGSIACGVGEGASAISDEVKNTLSDAGETVKDVALTLAKMFAGAAAGADFGNPLAGALGGLVAGIVEANNSSADHQPSADDWRQREQEHTAERGKYGLVLTPPEVPDPLITGDPDPNNNETAASVLLWNGTPAEKLVDRSTQLWWPNDDPHQPGYSGRWGVRVQNDSMLRRSGIPFPEFRGDFIRELLEAAVSS